MSEEAVAISRDPDVMSGTPVFVGSRVPFQALLDYLEAGQTLSEFLEDFPTVSREQAIASLERAKDARSGRPGAARAGTQSRCAPGRPSSTTNDARVEMGLPGRVTYSTTW